MKNEAIRPTFIVTSSELEKMLVEKPYLKVIDAYSRQLRELFIIQNHQYIGEDKKKTYQSADFKEYGESKKDDFIYVYYPWNDHVVKCVKGDDYFLLKTNRNEGLISKEEQIKLYNYKVAIFGMSVGSNIAFVMTQAGISREITLADFDELDTTNLNRILAGVHQIGLNKTIVAARRIYEDNPFAEITLLEKGVDENNLEELLKQGKIDCIVEEIDDMAFKVHSRILAMKYRVPVIMITDNGDGVVLHVERYDLGHQKLWGKDKKYFEEKLRGGPMTKEKAGNMIIGDIVGGKENVDPKMLAAVPKVINKEIVSWPQLGSAAILGAVVVTVMIKKIVLGENNEKDIRSYIDTFKIDHSTHS